MIDHEAYAQVPTRVGRLSVFRHDDPIGRSLREYGEWAGLELQFLGALVRPGDVVIDVGANVGTHALSFASIVGNGGKVIAIEAQPGIFELLLRNIRAVSFSNIQPIQAAALNDAGTVKIEPIDPTIHANFGATRLTTRADGLDVPSIQLDCLGLETCRLIKIDAEGAGGQVLLGALATVNRCRPLIYAECNTVSEAFDIWKCPALESYSKYFVRCMVFNFRNYLHNPHNVFGQAVETAILALPPGPKIDILDIEGVVVEKIDDLERLAAQVLFVSRITDEPGQPRTPEGAEIERLESELKRARLRELNLRRQVELLRQQPSPKPADILLGLLRRSRLWPFLAPLRRMVRQYLERGRR